MRLGRYEKSGHPRNSEAKEMRQYDVPQQADVGWKGSLTETMMFGLSSEGVKGGAREALAGNRVLSYE